MFFRLREHGPGRLDTDYFNPVQHFFDMTRVIAGTGPDVYLYTFPSL